MNIEDGWRCLVVHLIIFVYGSICVRRLGHSFLPSSWSRVNLKFYDASNKNFSRQENGMEKGCATKFY